ncbi:MAG TPA: glutamate-cysteine ligase family protein [Planctomycetota bacterium]|nr:glutamate-cysteine ligase family protein [Planctomycetota bacterium]
MPSPYRQLDREALREDLARTAFALDESRGDACSLALEVIAVRRRPRGLPPERVSLFPRPGEGAGLYELLERFARQHDLRLRGLRAVDLEDALEPEPGGLALGHGGQVLCASRLRETPAAAFAECSGALDLLREHLALHKIELISVGLDPWTPPGGVELQDPSASARCLEAALEGPDATAERLLRSAAGAPVRIAFGGPNKAALRWRAAQLAAPVAAACFAHAPLEAGQHLGFKSVRGVLRRLADPSLAAVPPGFEADPSGDPVDLYLELALCARVRWVRYANRWVPQRAPVSFEQWMEHGLGGAWPDLDDWRHHVKGLAAEVRPCGALEIGGADAQPRAFASVPLVFWSALLCDDVALSGSLDRLEPRANALHERWGAAARGGLLDPDLAGDARELFALAAGALLRLPPGWISREMATAFVAFAQRFALRGRTPADELLEDFLERGSLAVDAVVVPGREEPAAAASGAGRSG